MHGYLLAWPANYGSHFRTVLVYRTWFCDIIVKLSGKFIAKHLIDKCVSAHTHATYQEELDRIKVAIADEGKKRHTLQNLDCFVLDNSLRESIVGRLHGLTIENKWKIYNEVKRCGFKNIIVASVSHMTRVDDTFIKQLMENGEDPSTLYAFSEVIEGISKGMIDRETIPVGLAKMKKHGLKNPIIEFDLADKSIDWESCSVQDICKLIMKWIEWSRTNLSKASKIFVNFRDFPMAMTEVPERVLAAVDYFASLPQEKRLLGIIFEEPTGDYLPEEIGAWTTAVRKLMNARKWNNGLLLVHVHKKWGLAETVQLECLCSGADGIWASVAEEGAGNGHACSSITLMNLIRMGNKKVLERYNCTYLRKAAISVTNSTNGSDPHPKQVVYGERALDMSFDFGGIAGGRELSVVKDGSNVG
ncbi:uncharacterized protein LOC135348149 [Halichondria panicea]|uniref:uncharacterized protein LOC135348149 n=1 Tax=Halichondria panicea TaxID=6063 RepID=UPI00312B2F7E